MTDAEIDRLNGQWERDVTGPRIVRELERCAEAVRRGSIPVSLRVGVSLGILGSLLVWVLFLALPLLGFPSEAITFGGTGSGKGGGIRFLLLLGAVCSAGVFGALVQTLRSIRDGKAVTAPRASIDAVLGVAAGFITAALYLLAQIAIVGALELPTRDSDYARVALIVSMAAVFASLYLDAAFSRFDEVKSSLMSGTYGQKPGGNSTHGPET